MSLCAEAVMNRVNSPGSGQIMRKLMAHICPLFPLHRLSALLFVSGTQCTGTNREWALHSVFVSHGVDGIRGKPPVAGEFGRHSFSILAFAQ